MAGLSEMAPMEPPDFVCLVFNHCNADTSGRTDFDAGNLSPNLQT